MSAPIMQGSSIDSTLRGAYTASPIKYMLYGRGCITSLPTVMANLGASKAYIITGRSLREKTPVISRIEETKIHNPLREVGEEEREEREVR
ncbi:hypothetical protein ACJ72_07295 [Emergomyces africanus]|uniref:Alcohol dehydrogenase iron-type/glycerol dehydrogenase GldA domain-containing protein n=1 Tax=Emergomyces africanus TaxID=1955775 RepID=A0A1B7NNL7_9EURO|nr:hypothetical protein ACJ72_07295 [Emergomyces africanus]